MWRLPYSQTLHIHRNIWGPLWKIKEGRLKYILLPMVQIYAGEEFLPPHKDEECFWKGYLKKNTALMWSLQQPVQESISKTAQRYGRQRLKKWEYEANLEELGWLQNQDHEKLQLEGLPWSLENNTALPQQWQKRAHRKQWTDWIRSDLALLILVPRRKFNWEERKFFSNRKVEN